MRLWSRLRSWSRANLERSRMESEMDAELKFHMDAYANDLVRSGMPREEAMRRARLEFGGVERAKEECRDATGVTFIESLAQDIRYGLRMLRKSAGFTTVAVVTLALGIGANTAIFSMVNALAVRTPAVTRPEQVVTLAAQNVDGHYESRFSYPALEDVRNQSSGVFSDVATVGTYAMDGLSVDGKDEPMWTNYVSGNFFQMMGVKPALGSFIEPAPGKSVDDDPVLVLGYVYWQARFGGDPNVIGKSVLVNGRTVTIIGIAPKEFHGLTSFVDVQGYLPLGMAPLTGDLAKDFLTNRKASTGAIIARLNPGAGLATAESALKVIARRLSAQYPTTDKRRELVAYALGPMSPETSGNNQNAIRLMSALFLMLAGLVLILACVNVANLLLVRASGRQREMAVRAAVGGARSRLIRQLLTESFLLAFLGCGGGIALGLVSSQWISTINFRTSIPLVLDFQFDWRVFAYAFGAALLTVLLVGIAPALRATRGDLNNLLHENARTGSAARQRTQTILVMAQIGGSLMLLIVAGLFVRSLQSVEHENLGFDANYLLNFTIDPHEAGYSETQARELLPLLLRQLRSLPGVDAVSIAASVPMGYYGVDMDLKIDGYRPPSGQSGPRVGYNAVSPQYFETMRIPIVVGRGFLDYDRQTSPYVAVINEAMADKYWHGENPIGQRFTSTDDPKPSIEVVGIAKNSRVYGDFSDPIEPYLYVPLSQHYEYRIPLTLQVRAAVPTVALNHEVVGAIHSLAPAMPVFNVQTMSEALDTLNGFLLFQVGAGLAAALGILGLVLAIVGIYGVVSYSASQRTHEIGIRMALGAQPMDVLQMIFRKGIFIVGAGVFAGILGAAAIARLVRNFLSGVSPVDPLTYVSASILLAAIALLACYIPSRRAMRVDPLVALRYQ
jgi:predicted permease